MKKDLQQVLSCPGCDGPLSLNITREAEGEVESGTLRCGICAAEYPIVRFVPRFVKADNYSNSFGFQWNRFSRTQLDSTTGQSISRNRFFAQSAWQSAEMEGQWTLDVGCGAGRFAEVALATGARLVAVDYSSAVDACRENLGSNPRLDVVQADVYHLPFRPRTFAYVYCFGVLQHTPDVRAAFMALTRQLRGEARIVVDLYPRLFLNFIWPKYWIRPLTKRLRAETLLPLVARGVDLLWPASLALGRVPVFGRRLRHALPIANYEGILPLSASELKQWAILDTFDMLAPAHDQPQTAATLRAWFDEAGLENAEVFRRGLVVGRGRAPRAVAARR